MKNMQLAEAIEKTGQTFADMLKNIADELRGCWIVNHQDCARYLTDDEFENLQGLIKKVELLKEQKENEENGRKNKTD